MDILLSLAYIIHARTDIGREEIDNMLNRLSSSEQEDIMAGLAQEWLEEGMAKGYAKGQAEGLLRVRQSF